MTQLKRNKKSYQYQTSHEQNSERPWSNAFNDLRKNDFQSKILNSSKASIKYVERIRTFSKCKDLTVPSLMKFLKMDSTEKRE